MALFRASRERAGPDSYTNLKTIIFSIGAILALVGMALDNRWIIYFAIGVLAIGLVLRLVTARKEHHEQIEDDDDTSVN